MITFILPVLNEPYLPTLLKEIAEIIKEPYEVLIQTEKGLGFAVKCGIEKAHGEIIVVCDADGSHKIEYIPQMIELLDFNEIVVGSRYVKGGRTQDTFVRRVISRIYCEFAKELFGLNINDNMSGFIAAKKYVLDKYPISNSGFKWGLELLCKSSHEYTAVEFPIIFEQRKLGKSKANYKEAFRTLWFMLKLRRQV